MFYQNLCGFLAQTKERLEYDRAYLLYRGTDGTISYLADADYSKERQPGTDYQQITSAYDQALSPLPLHPQRAVCGQTESRLCAEILDGSYITTYLPLEDAQGGVVAVLGVDAKLKYSDFTV